MSQYFPAFDQVPKKGNYFVKPRYTPGSPAMVGDGLAWDIAWDEVEGYKRAFSGIYGEEIKAKALKDKLNWVVFARWEKGNKIYELDLITGKIRIKKFDKKKGCATFVS